jgi:hypothetical protein
MKGFRASVLRCFIMMSVSAIILSACGDEEGSCDSMLVSIAVTPADPNIKIGAARQFTATGEYSDGGARDITSSVTWSSSNTTVATVGNEGLATSVSVGLATIKATSGDISGAAGLTVKSAVRLAVTGQTSRYDSNILERDDGALQMGVAWPDPRFTYNANGTITDNLTGLIWLQDTGCFAAQPWSAALTTANTLVSGICGLSDGSQAGDWRLPNVNELESMTNSEQFDTITWLINQGFGNIVSGLYWSSTTFLVDSGKARSFFVLYGGLGWVDKASSLYVWPVRSGQEAAVAELPKTGQTTCYDGAFGISCTAAIAAGQDGALQMGVAWPDPRFVVGTGAGADCVTDNLTGLIWAKNGNLPEGPMAWQEGLNYVVSLNSGDKFRLCGYDDWRLPNRKELQSLIDHSKGYPALLPAGHPFTYVQNAFYWTSTTDAVFTDSAWVVNMGDGVVGGMMSKTTFDHYVWPVRSGQ